MCAAPPSVAETLAEDTRRLGESHERLPDQRRACLARAIGTAKTAVRDDRERAAEPALAVRTAAARHSPAEGEQLPLLCRAPFERLNCDAAQARARVTQREPFADPRLRQRALRDGERGAADAAVALQASQARARLPDGGRAVDDRAGCLLDEVAVPARAHVPEMSVAEKARRVPVGPERRSVGAAQRDPVVVEGSLGAVGCLLAE